MKKRKIIGHRGAAGLELENTATSIERAAHLNVSAIEIDVRLTKDGKLAVFHDNDLIRLADDPRKIRDLTLKELQKIELADGSNILSLSEALRILGELPVIIELKDHNTARPALETLKKFSKANACLASFDLQELAFARSLDPDIFLYGLERTKPFESIHLARILKLDGVGLNYWLLNPLTYWYARRSGLDIYVYTVNDKFRAKFLSWLYPEIAICTDHPEWFVNKLRKSRKKKGITHARHLRTHRN